MAKFNVGNPWKTRKRAMSGEERLFRRSRVHITSTEARWLGENERPALQGLALEESKSPFNDHNEI